MYYHWKTKWKKQYKKYREFALNRSYDPPPPTQQTFFTANNIFVTRFPLRLLKIFSEADYCRFYCIILFESCFIVIFEGSYFLLHFQQRGTKRNISAQFLMGVTIQTQFLQSPSQKEQGCVPKNRQCILLTLFVPSNSE